MISRFSQKYGWRSLSLPLILGLVEQEWKKQSPGCYFLCRLWFYRFWFYSFVFASFLSVLFFSCVPFLSHLLSACQPVPSSLIFPPLSPLTCLSHLLWALVLVPRPEHGQSHANFTIIAGPPGCRRRSSWEIYFACQDSTTNIIARGSRIIFWK